MSTENTVTSVNDTKLYPRMVLSEDELAYCVKDVEAVADAQKFFAEIIKESELDVDQVFSNIGEHLRDY